MLIRFILLLVVSANFGTLKAQDLMSVSWQHDITSNSYINHIYGLQTDSQGNVITFGSFPVEANMSGQTLYGNTGGYFLTKHDTAGNLIYGINFGATTSLSEGEMVISDDDEITVALNYLGNYYWSDTVLSTSTNFNAVVMKLDSSLNLLWYYEAPSYQGQVYPQGMAQDDDENVYVGIRFIDSLVVNGTLFLSNGATYSLLICKFDSLGNYEWSKQYASVPGTSLKNTIIGCYPNEIGGQDIIISGTNPSSILYIDGISQNIDTEHGTYISRLDTNGNILKAVRVNNVNYIVDFGFVEDRLFFAGMFHDTVNWIGGSTIPANKSAFIGELNDTLGLVNLVDLTTNSSIDLKGFSISEKFGFVLHGNYHQQPFTVQNTPINLITSPTNGAFMLTFDQAFDLNQAKYVPASHFNFREVCIKDTLMYAAGIFEGNLNFANASDHSWNEDVCVLRLNDLDSLAVFENLSLDDYLLVNAEIKTYPNPTNEKLHLSGLTNGNIDEVYIYDYSGRLKLRARVSESSIDVSDLPCGFYYLKIKEINDAPIRFIKE